MNRKTWLVLLFILGQITCTLAQSPIQPSTEITVSGQVEQDVKISIADLQKLPAIEIGSLDISNHAGEKRGTASDMKGVLVKDVLKEVKFKADTPRQLSEFYLTFVASDGYKAVFSWNELWNSPTGDHVFIITEKAGKKLEEMSDRILLVTMTDFKTGRRHIKALSRIVVGRVE